MEIALIMNDRKELGNYINLIEGIPGLGRVLYSSNKFDELISISKKISPFDSIIICDYFVGNKSAISSINPKKFLLPILFLADKCSEIDLKEIFKFNYIGLLFKPFNEDMLMGVVNKYLAASDLYFNKIVMNRYISAESKRNYDEYRIPVTNGKNNVVKFVDIKSITHFILKFDSLLAIDSKANSFKLIHNNYKKILNALDSKAFERVNRWNIVNRNYIDRVIISGSKRELVLLNGHRIKVSKYYYSKFYLWFK